MVETTGDQLILVSGGYDHTIKIWEAGSGVCIRTVQHPESVRIQLSTRSHCYFLRFIQFSASKHIGIGPQSLYAGQRGLPEHYPVRHELRFASGQL